MPPPGPARLKHWKWLAQQVIVAVTAAAQGSSTVTEPNWEPALPAILQKLRALQVASSKLQVPHRARARVTAAARGSSTVTEPNLELARPVTLQKLHQGPALDPKPKHPPH